MDEDERKDIMYALLDALDEMDIEDHEVREHWRVWIRNGGRRNEALG